MTSGSLTHDGTDVEHDLCCYQICDEFTFSPVRCPSGAGHGGLTDVAAPPSSHRPTGGEMDREGLDPARKNDQ
jgi:hypothetical protein